MWLWWVKIPTGDLTDMTLAIEETDDEDYEDDEDGEYDEYGEDDEGDEDDEDDEDDEEKKLSGDKGYPVIKVIYW